MNKLKLNIFLVMICLLFILSSCVNPEEEILSNYENISEYGDVIYGKRSDEYLQIIGLTEKGKETKNLVIPSKINGEYVMGVGITADQDWDDIYRYDYFPRKGKDAFENNNVEVIYNGAHHVHDGVIDEIVKNGNVKKIVNFCFECKPVPSWMDCFPYTIYDKYCDTIVVSPDYYQNNECKENWVSANVLFYINDDLYWIDYYAEDSLIFEPPVPTKEGRDFAGWVTEFYDSKQKVWDFDEDLFIYDEEKESTIVFHATWEHK